MKALNVSNSRALIEFSVDELYRISESLDAVITQNNIIDKKIATYPKQVYQEVHEELTDMILKITDEKGGFIPS